jgi:hypothetical protein
MSAMDVEVIDTSSAAQWDKALAVIPEERRDIYFTAEYASLYEGPRVRAQCIAVHGGGDSLVHVFTERRLTAVGGRPLERECRIAASVYGYGGPLSTTDDPAFLGPAFGALEARQRQDGIVSEFVRFHPLLDNVRWAPAAWAPTLDRHTVAMDLSRDERQAWDDDYPSTHRNRIRRARAAGLRVETSADEADTVAFTEIYGETMRRVGARAFVRFSRAYFEGLRTRLGAGFVLFVVRSQARVVAGAVVLAFGRLLHHHLSGSTEEAQHVGANNLLFHEIAAWGRARGYRWLHLGGGASPRADDQLLRFKRNFSPIGTPFHIGRIVYDPTGHEALRALWRDTHPGVVDPGYFQIYAADDEVAP